MNLLSELAGKIRNGVVNAFPHFQSEVQYPAFIPVGVCSPNGDEGRVLRNRAL